MSAVVCQLVLDAGPWGAGVAAAEGDSIHQELPINVAVQTATTGQSLGITNLVAAAGSACDFRKGSDTILLQCSPLQHNKRKMRIYFQLEKLFTAGTLNIGFAVFNSGVGDDAFLGIFVLNTKDNFSTCLSWWNSNGSYILGNPVFHYFWINLST